MLSGFRLRVPSLEGHLFSPGTTVLLAGRPGAGKSVFAQQLVSEGLNLGQHAILAVTDTPAPSILDRAAKTTSGVQLHILDFLLEKPRSINDVSITVHQLIARLAGEPVRVVFDSLSTLGMMFGPGLIPPWVLDQRSRFMKHKANVLAMLVYDTGIHPPSITRSLQAISDAVFEMKVDESTGEPKRLFRVFSARGAAHSPKWFPCMIDNEGLRFGDPS